MTSLHFEMEKYNAINSIKNERMSAFAHIRSNSSLPIATLSLRTLFKKSQSQSAEMEEILFQSAQLLVLSDAFFALVERPKDSGEVGANDVQFRQDGKPLTLTREKHG